VTDVLRPPAEARGDRDPEGEDAGDGRNVDLTVAELEGEGAQQAVPKERSTSEGAAPFEIWERTPADVADDDPTYYERPVLKEPVWIWAIPAYFYVGGVAGGAAALGAAAQAADREGLDRLMRRCRWLAATGTSVGAGLLVYDLGRPARFLNMLRVFRPTSPLSVGSWILAGSGPLAAGSALLARKDGLAGAVGDLAGAGAGVLGPPLAGYTGVLLASTAVPLWREAGRTLPALFEASAATSVASLLDLMDLDEREARIVGRFGTAGRLAELAAAEAVAREVERNETVARPLHEGVSGALWRSSKALVAASLAVSALGRRRRWVRVASGLLGTAGSIALRFAVFHAGKASARDPRATFHSQRA